MSWFQKYIAKARFLSLVGLATLTVLLVGLRSPATAQAAKHYTDLDFPPLPEIQVPDYSRYQLDNGMVVYLMEDRELPLIEGVALIRTGARFEPAEKVGLASLTGQVMRSGGTEPHPAEELNQLLEQRAASVETGIGDTSGSATFTALSEDAETVFGLFAEVLRQPAFAEDKLEIAKTRERGDIARRNDDPGSIAGREFQKLIYGDRSPYARTTEYATIDRIAREDLVDFYQQYVHPNNIILGVVGDFDSDAMLQLVQQQFGDWQPQPNLQLPAQPEVDQARAGGVFFIDRPQLTQSYVQLGHLGGRLDSPDYAALSVMNGVLNGFGGRLFNEVRSRQGLAYSVYGYWDAEYDYPGVFLAGGQTRSDATVPFIQSVLSQIDRIRTEPVAQSELDYAKESTLNSFVFNFTDEGRILSRLLRYDYFGYPEDFIFQYQQEVETTTVEDVLRVAREYLQPENIVTLVVGNPSEIQPPLSSLGDNVQVQSIDISIPQPQA